MLIQAKGDGDWEQDGTVRVWGGMWSDCLVGLRGFATGWNEFLD